MSYVETWKKKEVEAEDESLLKVLVKKMENMEKDMKEMKDKSSGSRSANSQYSRGGGGGYSKCKKCETDNVAWCKHCFKCGSSDHYSYNCKSENGTRLQK